MIHVMTLESIFFVSFFFFGRLKIVDAKETDTWGGVADEKCQMRSHPLFTPSLSLRATSPIYGK